MTNISELGLVFFRIFFNFFKISLKVWFLYFTSIASLFYWFLSGSIDDSTCSFYYFLNFLFKSLIIKLHLGECNQSGYSDKYSFVRLSFFHIYLFPLNFFFLIFSRKFDFDILLLLLHCFTDPSQASIDDSLVCFGLIRNSRNID